MSKPKKYLIVIAGPTAVGKTSTAIKVAHYFNAEILSADSRQFYKELNIGVARPSNEELSTVKHHFIGHISIKQEYSAADFETEALECLNTLYKKHNVAVLAGGSGLFINALLNGLDTLPKNEAIRQQLNNRLENEGIEVLSKQLKALDFEEYTAIDIANPRRVIRALEICLASGEKASALKKSQKVERPFTPIKIVLNIEREGLYNRINKRVDEMIANGLVAEAKGLLSFKHLNALSTVGYKELFEHFEGKTSLESATELIQQHTRNYAKRQLTWFRKDKDYEWFAPKDFDKIIGYCSKSMNQ